MNPFCRLIPIALSLVVAAGCGIGDATGNGDGDGDGNGDGPGADAIPIEGIVCITEFTVTGTVTHDVVPGESCDGTGTWTINLGTPVADEDYEACADAPASETFTFTVTRVENQYSAVDVDDGTRVWDAQVRDKGGSCSATFNHDLGGGAEWSLGPGEDGPDGPLDGVGRYEVRM